MRTSVDVHNYLQGIEMPHEIFLLERPAKTAERAAALLGLHPSEIVKVVVFMVDDKPLAVLLPGNRRVNYARLKKHAGTKNVRLASHAELLELTDYPIGATPPVALKEDVPVCLDEALERAEILYTAAGELNAILKVRCRDLVSNLGAKLAPLCKEQAEAEASPPPS